MSMNPIQAQGQQDMPKDMPKDMPTLPRVFAEFMLVGERSGIGLSVPVVPEADIPLTEGERVILTDYTDLWAEGALTAIEQDGRRYWYGKLESRAAIHDILPATPADAQPAAPVAQS
ncbi:MAG TPA: hypothetical protein VKQ36_00200 [Ktedonobacterales bacterium]|nr:hypothetical protein [Ktedonobacterales bacterium]